MNNLDRMVKLYSDWASTQDNEKLNETKSILESATKESSKFIKLYEAMGEDGNRMKQLFEDSWSEINDNKIVAKRKVAFKLLEDYSSDTPKVDRAGNFYNEFGMAYTPIADIADKQEQKYSTNQMQTDISDSSRDVIIQIRNAIVGGNFQIANALLLNFWGRLSVKARVDIMTWAFNIGNYNSLIDVPQSKGVNFKSLKEKIEKKEISKEEFATVFLRTAKEKMQIS